MTIPNDPNVSTLTQAGLQVESQTNLVAYLVSALQSIYGPSINVQSNSPDGQLINIFAQADQDMLELLLSTYNNFAVPTAFGTRLDQLVALNGLVRIQGTFTLAQVSVTFTGAVTLPGLDQTLIPAFTVADGAGNQYQLLTSHVQGGAGTVTLTFQAANIGQVQTSPNTITNIITPNAAVSTVNNPSTSSDTIGVNEETDTQLKIRHAQSFQLASTGPADALESALRQVPGIVDAFVAENATGGIVNGIPAFGVWCIVNQGTATAAAIAQAIYSKKGIGCAMKGSQSFNVARPNGQTFVALYDLAISQNLFIAFSLIWRGPVVLSNADVEAQLIAALSYKLGQNPSIGDVVTAMLTIAPTAIVTFGVNQGVSLTGLSGSFSSTVSPTDSQHYFGTITVTIT